MSLLPLDADWPVSAAIDPHRGAALADLRVVGPDGFPYPLLRPTPPRSTTGPGHPFHTGMFLMLPWTNRVAGARFTFRGASHRLCPNFPDGTAIHGEAAHRPWTLVDRTPVSAMLDLRYDAPADGTNSEMVADDRAGFPLSFAATVRYELRPRGLRTELTLTNTSDHPMPAGLGLHPTFARALWAPDQVTLETIVSGRYPAARQIPTGPAAPDAVCQTFKTGAPPPPDLDDVFAGFGQTATLRYPSSGVTVRMTTSTDFTHLVVFTPATPYFAVEPCTMVNDGFNRFEAGDDTSGVRVLEPGDAINAWVDLSIETDGTRPNHFGERHP